MKNNTLSKTAFTVTISAIILTLAMIAFSSGIRKLDWLDLEHLAIACFGLSFLGCVLGWISMKRPLGKLSAILGSLAVAGFLFQLISSSDPDVSPEPSDDPKKAISTNNKWVTVFKHHPGMRPKIEEKTHDAALIELICSQFVSDISHNGNFGSGFALEIPRADLAMWLKQIDLLHEKGQLQYYKKYGIDKNGYGLVEFDRDTRTEDPEAP